MHLGHWSLAVCQFFSTISLILGIAGFGWGADFLPVEPNDQRSIDDFQKFGFLPTLEMEDFESGEFTKNGLIVDSTDPWSIQKGFSVPTDTLPDEVGGYALEAKHVQCATSFPSICPASVSFSFDPAVFETLPTFAGFVWTDAHRAGEESGFPILRVTVTNNDGIESSQVVHSVLAKDDVSDDTFIGLVDAAGISSLNVTVITDGTDRGGHFAIDQLQYGLAALPGDINLDGAVDFSDFIGFSSYFGQAGSNWSSGDFNFDGRSDFSDFLDLSANFGLRQQSTNDSLASVPEPSPGTGLLFVIGTIALMLRRRL